MTRSNLARTDSLARSSREEVATDNFSGMSLDQFYKMLGKAAKAEYEAGNISQAFYMARIEALRIEYRNLKARGI